MEKRILFFEFVFSIVLFLSCNDHNAISLINEINRKHGDKEFLSSIKTLKQTWILSAEGTNFKYTTYFERPNKLRLMISFMDGSPLITTVYANGRGYEELIGVKRCLTQEELKEYEVKCNRWIDGYYNYKENGDRFEMIDSERIDEIEFHVLLITDKYNNKTKIYIDPTSGYERINEQIRFDELSKQNKLNKIHLNKYKNFNGLIIASEITIIDSDNKSQTLKLETSINNLTFDKKIFNIK